MGYLEAFQAAKASKLIKSRTPKFHKWSMEDNLVVGRFLKKEEVFKKGEKQPFSNYIFETDSGSICFNLGAQVEEKLGIQFAENTIYGIEYLGKKELEGGKRLNQFEICEIPEDIYQRMLDELAEQEQAELDAAADTSESETDNPPEVPAEGSGNSGGKKHKK